MEHYGHDSRTRLRGNSRAYNDGLGDQLTRLGKISQSNMAGKFQILHLQDGAPQLQVGLQPHFNI